MNAVEFGNVSKYYALADSQWSRLRRIFSPVYPAPSSSHNRSAARDICALSDITFP